MDVEPIQHSDDMLAAQALPHLNGHTLSCTHSDDREGAKSAAIHRVISHKVECPSFIRSRHRRPVHSEYQTTYYFGPHNQGPVAGWTSERGPDGIT